MVAVCNVIKGSIQDAKKLLLSESIAATELCKKSLKQIDNTQKLNVFTTVCKQEAITDASTSSAIYKQGKNVRSLEGIPISIKDNICTKGILTTCASKMLHNFVPPYDAHLVTRLKSAGAVIVGKTNMDEFAMGSSSTTSYYGPTANSWGSFGARNQSSVINDAANTPLKPSCENSDSWFMAGGSSTGSAVSVATGSSFASIGTDTGGSTRQPASLVGVVGFKPSYGLISRFGLIPLVHALDVVSILARSVADARTIFEVVRGQDETDLTSVDFVKTLKSNLSGNSECNKIRVGIPRDFLAKADMDAAVAEAFDATVKVLERCSAPKIEIVTIELDHAKAASECYTIVSSCEIASNMSCFDGIKYGFSVPPSNLREFSYEQFFKANRDEAFGDEVKKRILLGNYFLLEHNRDNYLTQALKVRRLISEEFDRVFGTSKIDLILTPSTPTTAISYKEWLKKQDTNKLFYEDYFLIPSNLANLPAISVPVYPTCSDGSLGGAKPPVGVQLIANKYHDDDLLFLAQLFERTMTKLDS